MDSYHYLSSGARDLFRKYAAASGNPGSGNTYNRLEQSRRTTFESITGALDMVRLTDPQGNPMGSVLDLIEQVEEIWGAEPSSVRGEDQFRLSVRLKSDAVSRLESAREFKSKESTGHVKLKYGTVIGCWYCWRDVDGIRQEGRRPTIQISWLENNPTTGEVDIDYRETREGHLSPENSDVRARVASGQSH